MYIKEIRSNFTAPLICLYIGEAKPSRDIICINAPLHETSISTTLCFIVKDANQLDKALIALIQLAHDYLSQIDEPPKKCELSILVPYTFAEDSNMVYRFGWELKY
ncbi:hypothetical protein [Cellulosilyticum sp. I15G10I2]|uniref:hypothetical protein n=1 Tax=Cellulosilyticum sp. I15G10I2 TaxID=1892843 RepID=UPI00114C8766|nr:hypothetical protein [Cellulosilyticum sp. I15G10I2]